MEHEDLQKAMECIVDKSEKELTKSGNLEQWRGNYSRYAKNINESFRGYIKGGEDIRKSKNAIPKDGKLSIDIVDEIQIYSSISMVPKSKKSTMKYDMRFRGQSICRVEYNGDKSIKAIFSDKKIEKIKNSFFKNEKVSLGVMAREEGYEIDGDEIKQLINTLKGKKPSGSEHQLESLVLRELYKKSSKRKHPKFCWIRPTTLGDCFFQLTTPLNGSDHKHKGEYAKNGIGGGIDILARVSKEGGKKDWRFAVIELKDKYEKDEPVDEVMKQALTYATFIAYLLADEEFGDDWYNILRDRHQLKRRKKVPNKIEILAVTMMPPYEGASKEMEKALEDIKTLTPIKVKGIVKKEITLIPCTYFITANGETTKIISAEGSLENYKRQTTT